MNSSLRRTCAARGRLVHRSKNLERKVLVLPSGAQLVLGMVVSRAKGTTFDRNITKYKRGAPAGHPQPSQTDVAAYKRAAWETARV